MIRAEIHVRHTVDVTYTLAQAIHLVLIHHLVHLIQEATMGALLNYQQVI